MFLQNFLSVLSMLDFSWSNMFLTYLYGSWKKHSCSFLCFTQLILRLSALLRALCFIFEVLLDFKRPSFLSSIQQASMLDAGGNFILGKTGCISSFDSAALISSVLWSASWFWFSIVFPVLEECWSWNAV